MVEFIVCYGYYVLVLDYEENCVLRFQYIEEEFKQVKYTWNFNSRFQNINKNMLIILVLKSEHQVINYLLI